VCLAPEVAAIWVVALLAADALQKIQDKVDVVALVGSPHVLAVVATGSCTHIMLNLLLLYNVKSVITVNIICAIIITITTTIILIIIRNNYDNSYCNDTKYWASD
jgi:hypothetical protein